MGKFKTYKVGNDVYDIHESRQEEFLLDAPNAIEVESFTVEGDTFDIPVGRVEEFLKDAPKAMPLKKKDIAEVSAEAYSMPTKSVFGDYEKEFVTKRDETIVNTPISKPTIDVDEIKKNLPDGDEETVKDILREKALTQDIKNRSESIIKSFDLDLGKAEFGEYANEIMREKGYTPSRKLADGKVLAMTSLLDYVTPIKTVDKSVGAFVGGSVNSLYNHFGNTFRQWDRITEMVDQALGGVPGYLFAVAGQSTSPEMFTKARLQEMYATAKEPEIKKSLGELVNEQRKKTAPLLQVAKWYEGEAKTFKKMPETFLGKTLDMSLAVIPFIAEVAFTPEIRIATAATTVPFKTPIMNAVPKLVTLEATKGYFTGVDESEAETFLGKAWDGYKGMGVGAGHGLFLHSLGIGAQTFGKLTRSPILNANTSAVLNGIGFMGLEAANMYAEEGKLDWERLSATGLMGYTIGVPSVARMIGVKGGKNMLLIDAKRKAVKNFFSTSPEAVNMVHKMDINPFQLRRESVRLGVEASKEKNPDIRGEKLAAKNYIDNVIDINAVTSDIVRNPEHWKKQIDKSLSLTPVEKKAAHNLIDLTIENNKPIEIKPSEVVEGRIEGGKTIKEGEVKVKEEKPSGAPKLSEMETELIAKGYTPERAKEMKDMFDFMTENYNIEPIEYAKQQKEKVKEKEVIDVFNLQDEGAERIVSKSWKGEGGNVWRYKFENAGDIIRELAKYENEFLAPSYIYEKIDKIKDFIEQYEGDLVHKFDKYSTLKVENKENLGALKKAYEDLPVMSDAQQQAKNLVLNLINGDLKSARKQIEYFDNFRNKKNVKEALQKANTYIIKEEPKYESIQKQKTEKLPEKEQAKVVQKVEKEVRLEDKEKLQKEIKKSDYEDADFALIDALKAAGEGDVKKVDQIKKLYKDTFTEADVKQVDETLNRKNFNDSKEKLRETLDKVFTKQAIGEKPASLPELYNALVDFIKQAIKLYGPKIKSARDVAKYTGVKYNKALKDAYKEATTGKKISEDKMRGFPKRIKEFQEFKNIKLDIEENPELRYTPQKFADIKEKLKTMSEKEIVAATDDIYNFRLAEKNNNVGVLAGIELINRYRAQGKDVMPVIEHLSKAGTTMGQLIRQFGELKSSTPEGIVVTIDKKLGFIGRKLTDQQKQDLKSLSEDYLNKKQRLNEQVEKTKKEFTDNNVNEYNKLKKEVDGSYIKLAQKTQRLMPKDFWDMMGMTLQGNLLTPMSQITNIYANLMNIPITSGASVIATPIDALHTVVTGKPRATTINPRVILEGLKGFGYGFKESAKQILTGVPTQEKAELKTGFQPIRAIQQAFSGKDMPVNVKGKIPVKARINKIIEGVVGAPAEVMFRFLNLGDKPFYRMAERTNLYRIGKDQGLKGRDLKKFIMFPDIKASKMAEDAARQATFQENSTTARIATDVTGTIYKSLGEIPMVGGGLKFLMKTQMPYVKTPANIISQSLDIAVPPISIGKAIHYAYIGNKRESLMHIGKAGVGIMIGLAAEEMLTHNLITGSPDEERKVRNLQYENLPPNSVNISGVGRLIKGRDPSYRDGDHAVNFTKMGLVGMSLGVHANVYEERKKLLAKQQEMLKVNPQQNKSSEFAIKLVATILEVPAYSLEQSFLKGTSSFLTAINEKRWDYWLTNTFNAVSSVPLPNTLGAINRATREYIPELKGNSIRERLGNVIRSKTFATEDLALKINLWGEPIKQTPEGADAWLYQLFDVTKHRQLMVKPESKFIYDLYLKTEDSDVLPSVPSRTLIIKNKKLYLTDKQYEEYLRVIGKGRYEKFHKVLESGKLKDKTDEQKIDYLNDIWGRVLKIQKRKFIKGIE